MKTMPFYRFNSAVKLLRALQRTWLTLLEREPLKVATKEGYYEADLMAQDLTEYSEYQRNNSYVIRKVMLKKEEPLIREHKAFAAFIETGHRNGLSSIEDSMITLDISSKNNHVSKSAYTTQYGWSK